MTSISELEIALQAGYEHGQADLSSEISDLKRQLSEAREIIGFYADKHNWITRGHPQIDAHDTAVNKDKGDRARSFLKEMEG